jgi:hypothetical protein
LARRAALFLDVDLSKIPPCFGKEYEIKYGDTSNLYSKYAITRNDIIKYLK